MQNKLQRVNSRIQNAAIKSGRNPENITIIAVTKSFSPGIWDTALEHNLITIGESRIQEAEIKNKKFNNRKKNRTPSHWPFTEQQSKKGHTTF